MKQVIADTGPLYAALDPDDQYHERAQAEYVQLEAEQISAIIPIPVYLETYSLLLYRLGNAQAITFARECLEANCLINPTPEDYQTAVSQASRFLDQKITLADATTAILAKAMNLPVWTYDFHFDVMHVLVWR